MTKARRFTLADFAAGRGSKRQRAAFVKAIASASIAERMRTIAAAAELLQQVTGATIAPGDDLPSLIERVRDDPRAALVLELLRAVDAAQATVRALQRMPATRGRAGGKAKAARDKSPSGATATQARRKRHYLALIGQRRSPGDALDEVAASEGVTTSAVRQSLRSAGARVSTSERRGKRR